MKKCEIVYRMSAESDIDGLDVHEVTGVMYVFAETVEAAIEETGKRKHDRYKRSFVKVTPPAFFLLRWVYFLVPFAGLQSMPISLFCSGNIGCAGPLSLRGECSGGMLLYQNFATLPIIVIHE